MGRGNHLGPHHVPPFRGIRAPRATDSHRGHPHYRCQRGRERAHAHGTALPHPLRAHRLRSRGAVAASAHRSVLRGQRGHGRDAAAAARARGPHPHYRHPRQPRLLPRLRQGHRTGEFRPARGQDRGARPGRREAAATLRALPRGLRRASPLHAPAAEHAAGHRGRSRRGVRAPRAARGRGLRLGQRHRARLCKRDGRAASR